MKFRTSIDIPSYHTKLDYKSLSVFTGSCFSNNIGEKLQKLKFPTSINPFGALYNPASIKKAIDRLIDPVPYEEITLQFHNGLWFSFDHHGSFSNANKDICLENINNRLIEYSARLKKADFLFITFGTAWVYQNIKSNEIVANCHKIPAKEFDRFLLDVNTITADYNQLLVRLSRINSKIKIIFTISPIRHWKDGAIQNQISKSTLILAIHHLITQHANTCYFPVYEIMMDELRDYRFYGKDMLHISESALEYIWEKFIDTFISDDSKEIMKHMDKILKAKEHRPFNTNTDHYKTFLKSQIEQIKSLKSQFPFLKIEEELKFFLTLIKEDFNSK